MRKKLKKPLILLLLLSFLLTSIPFPLSFADDNPPVQEDLYPLYDMPGMQQVKITAEDIAYFKNKSAMVTIESLIPSIGTQKTFMATDGTNPKNPTLYEVKADLKRVNAHSYIYLETGTTGITDDMIAAISEQFEIVYSKETSLFGTEPDVDYDKRINILLLDIKEDTTDKAYIAGYFAPYNELPKTVLSYSNECEMFYMDTQKCLQGGNTIPQEIKDTLAHEFQHLVQYGTYMRNISPQYQDIEETWLDEGLAELARFLVYGTYSKKNVEYLLQNYTGAPDSANLLDWESSLSNCGDSFLFALYLYNRFGSQFVKDLAMDPRTGVDSINYQLMSHNNSYTFDDIFEQYKVALVADDIAGIYSILPLRINSIRNELLNSSDSASLYGFLDLDTPTNISTNSRHRSFFHILQGNNSGFNALSFSFANENGDYYLIKSQLACPTFEQFATMQKTVEKIDVHQGTPWTTNLDEGQMCALLYIAKSQPIDNTVTVTGVANDPNSAPSIPQIVSAVAGSSYVTLKWNPSTYDKGITGYKVTRNDGHQSIVITPQTLNVQNSITDYSVEPNTSYTYYVEAIGSDLKSSRTQPYKITTKPAVPTLETPELIFLETNEENGKAYITYKIKGGSASPSLNIISISTDGLIFDRRSAQPSANPLIDSFYIGGLTPGLIYTIYANSKDGNNRYSPRSNGLHIKAGAQGGPVPGLIPPSIPENIRSSEQTISSITLEWDPSSSEKGIFGYNIFRDNLFIGTTSSTSYKDTGLVRNQKYTYFVEAIDNSSLKLNSGYNTPFEVLTKSGTSLLEADTTDNTVDNKLEITFTDNPEWRNAMTAVKVDSNTLAPSDYEISVDTTQSKGKITINPGVIQTAGTVTITVSATNYKDETVNQTILPGCISIEKSRVDMYEQYPPFGVRVFYITAYAKDQYGNTVPDHRFFADVKVINTNTATNESYTFDKAIYTSATKDIPLSAVTGSHGIVVVKLIAPLTIDSNDGVIITFKPTAGGQIIQYPCEVIHRTSPPVLVPDTTENDVDHNLEITFEDDPVWRKAIYGIKVGNTRVDLNNIAPGKITIPAGIATSATRYNVQVAAMGYETANIEQPVYPGAATLEKSTIEINDALLVNATRTIKMTAKDKYSNTAPGHQFYADLTIVKNNNAIIEQYIFNGTAYSANASNVPAGVPTTNAGGKTTVNIQLPKTMDNGDGISIAIKLTSSGPVLKTYHYTYSSTISDAPTLTADTTNNNVDNDLEILFNDNPNWRESINSIDIDGTKLQDSQYLASYEPSLSKGIITIKQGTIRRAGAHKIVIHAANYNDGVVSQVVEPGKLSIYASHASEFIASDTDSKITYIFLAEAFDQYDNGIPNYRFYADVDIINTNGKTNEAYVFDGKIYTTGKSDIPLSILTDQYGFAHITAEVPKARDLDDGVIYRIKTGVTGAAGTATIGSWQFVTKTPPALVADTTDNTVDNPIEITYADNPLWRQGSMDITVDNEDYVVAISVQPGKIILPPITTVGNHTIRIEKNGYAPTEVIQSILPGKAVPEKSIVEINDALDANTTRTLTLTAKDKLGNPVPGHQFYADLTLIKNTVAINEQYIFNGTAYTANASNVPAGSPTGQDGKATVSIQLPEVIDNGDGIAVAIKLANSGNALKAYSYTHSSTIKDAPVLTADTTENNIDNDIVIEFNDDPTWRKSIYSIEVGNTKLQDSQYLVSYDPSLSKGKITIRQGTIQSEAIHEINIHAANYKDAIVKQTVLHGRMDESKSAVEINSALAVNVARTITMTAKDQYGNPVSGHQFYADLTLIRNTGAINEQYIFNGTAYTANAANVPAGSPTGQDGKSTVIIQLPVKIDNGDGITVVVKLTNGGTIMNRYSYTYIDSNAGVIYPGGGTPAVPSPTPTPIPIPIPIPTPTPVTSPTPTSSPAVTTTPEPVPGSAPTAGIWDLSIPLDKTTKLLKGSNKYLSVSIPWDALKGTAAEKAPKGSILHIQLKKVNEPKARMSQPQIQTMSNAVYDLKVELITGKKAQSINSFKGDIQIGLSLADYKANDINLSNLSVYAFNPKTKLWEYRSSQYNKKSKVITFKTAMCACFAVKKYKKVFTDINTHKNRIAIEKLAGMHLFDNMYNNKFKPDSKITKAEFTVMLVRALGISTNTKNMINYKDVTKNKYYYPEIAAAVKLGLVKGKSAKYFGVEETLTREQMALIVTKAFNLSGRIPSEALSNKSNAKEIMTRAQAAVLIDAMMEAKEN